jgi:hypothetical protein
MLKYGQPNKMLMLVDQYIMPAKDYDAHVAKMAEV